MGRDNEVVAMEALALALEPLDEKTRVRVLKWASDRFSAGQGIGSTPSQVQTINSEARQTESTFEDLPAFYAEIGPSTDSEKALVVGYWFQVIEGQGEFYAYGVNARLKDMGYKVGNITRAFEALIEATPQLVIQVGKGGSGDSKQARKKLKLTTEGVRRVKTMLGQRKTQLS